MEAMMTFRELVFDVCEVDDDPMCALVCALQLLRSTVQREAATDEGVTASINEWKRHYGDITSAKVRAWVENIPRIAALEIPDEAIEKYLMADE
jgi:hypothetical protein